MLAVSAPVESVAGVFWAIVPSLEFNVIGRFATGFPFASAAATESSHGPFGEPEYAGVPRITRLAAGIIGFTVNCAAEEVPPPGAGFVTLMLADPADATCALGTNAVRLVDDR
jgi:hypothetical protein